MRKIGGSDRFGRKVRPVAIKATVKRLFKLFKQEKGHLGITIISVLIAATAMLVAPYLMGAAIDAMTLGDGQQVVVLALWLFMMYLGAAGFNWLSQFSVAKASQNLLHRLRKTLFEKLEKLPLTYFDQNPHGDIMSRFTNDLDAVGEVVSQSTITLLSSLYGVVGTVLMMVYLNRPLTVGVMVSVPLIWGLSKWIGKKTIHFFKGQQQAVGELGGVVEETVYGLPVIHSFHQEAHMLAAFQVANEAVYRYGKAAQIYSGLLMPIMNVINNLTFAIIGLLGGYLVIRGQISVGIVVSFIAYSRHFVRPLNELAFIYNSLMAAIAGAERVFQVLDEKVEVRNEMGVKATLKGAITFDQVSFAYVPGEPVLHGVSFSIQPGQKVALVGPTGSGKTTIVNLLTNFYRHQTGKILVDGQPIENYHYSHYMQQFGIVTQDAYLFSGSIYDNIRYACPSASDEAVQEAAKVAKVDGIIKRLPENYKTQLNFGGMNISHGERQLITIARATLSKPQIFILDEATSSVDLRTERAITAAMTHLLADKTSLIIAHRLSTIKDADWILVLKEGRLIEQGHHTKLMGQKGFYYSLVMAQS